MEEKVWIKMEGDAIYNEDRSDAFDYPIDINYEPLAIKQELVEIAELEDGSVQVGNILIAKAEVDSDINIEEIGYCLSAVEWKCDICGKCFINGLDLVTHRYTHTEDCYYTCCICNCNTFHLKPDLRRHMLNVHLNLTSMLPTFAEVNTPKPSKTTEKPYKCEICQKRFLRTSSLTIHKRSHTGEKPYKCAICNKQFAANYNLTVHIRIHSGEKPYICYTCNKRFASNRYLREHSRVHSGEQPFECDICHKRFNHNSGLARHNYVHSTEKPHKCDMCNKLFVYKSDLTVHYRTHSGVKPYECNVCQKSFTQASSLTRHKRCHSGEKT